MVASSIALKTVSLRRSPANAAARCLRGKAHPCGSEVVLWGHSMLARHGVQVTLP
jgi:hypothetical protein